jgi:hypothetical protein
MTPDIPLTGVEGEKWMKRFESKLQWKSYVPPIVKEKYKLQYEKDTLVDEQLPLFVRINKIALWHRGIRKSTPEDNLGDGNETFMVQLCSPCRASLVNLKVPGPPKLALCNNFVAGELPPELKDATWQETRMVTIAPISGLVRIVGFHRNELCSHSLAFMAAPSLPAQQVSNIIRRFHIY